MEQAILVYVDLAGIPILSAMSVLGAKDNEMHSYLEIAGAIRQMSASPKEDLEALWRRIVFNVLISADLLVQIKTNPGKNSLRPKIALC